MPSVVVQIKWDVPDDPGWVDDLSIELALAEYCPETLITVTGAGDVVEALKNIRDTVESCYVAGDWLPLITEEMESIASLANDALAALEAAE